MHNPSPDPADKSADDELKQDVQDTNDLQSANLPGVRMNTASAQQQTGAMLFSHIQAAPDDPILGLKKKFLADQNPDKVDLSAGVYKDDQGKTTKLQSVSQAESAIQAKTAGGYLPIDGDPTYKEKVQELIFGSGSSILKDKRVASVQSVGGTSALFYGARFIKKYLPDAGIHISNPTWANHKGVFQSEGLAISEYPYYDTQKNEVDFDAMLSSVKALADGSVVLLHGCCHNPTGMDLNAKQWDELVDHFKSGRLLPFIDFAYQGFAEGIEQDASAIRKFADAGIPFMVANSFSKNFSLYNRRVGALHIVGETEQETQAILSQLKRVVRTSNSNPPIDGALIAAEILSDQNLRQTWEGELESMRLRIKDMRKLLVDGMAARGAGDAFSHVGLQNGMFSYSGLNPQQVAELQDKYSIYAVGSGRICVASLTSSNIEYVMDALAAVV